MRFEAICYLPGALPGCPEDQASVLSFTANLTPVAGDEMSRTAASCSYRASQGAVSHRTARTLPASRTPQSKNSSRASGQATLQRADREPPR